MSNWSWDDLKKHLSSADASASAMPKSPAQYGNWQRYAGMNPDLPGIQGDMANPSNFGSFQQFANMGGGMGVPPTAPQAPVAPTMQQVGNRFGQVVDQLKQGNIRDAVSTYQYGPKPVQPVALQPVASVQEQPDNMTYEFED